MTSKETNIVDIVPDSVGEDNNITTIEDESSHNNDIHNNNDYNTPPSEEEIRILLRPQPSPPTNNNSNSSSNNNNNSQSQSQCEEDADARMANKLRKILDSVSLQESDLQLKTGKLNQWYLLHDRTLTKAIKVKSCLIAFDATNCNATEKQLKKQEINSFLDALEKDLQQINKSEKKYRSRTVNNEVEQYKETIRKLENLKNVLFNQTKNTQTKLEQSKELENDANKRCSELEQQYEQRIQSLKSDHNKQLKNSLQEQQSKHERLLDDVNKKLKKKLLDDKQEFESRIESLTLKLERESEQAAKNLELRVSNLTIEHKLILEENEQQLKELGMKNTNLENGILSYKNLITEHKSLRIAWTEHKTKLKNDINEYQLEIEQLNQSVNNVKDANLILQQNTASHDLQRQKVETQLTELRINHTQKSKLLKKEKAEKIALVKAVKRLRVEKEQLIEKYTSENADLILKYEDEESNLKLNSDQQIRQLKQCVHNLESQVKHLTISNIQRFQSYNKYLKDVNSKLQVFTQSLDNCAPELLKKNAPDLDEATTALYEKSNSIIGQLLFTIQSALKKQDEIHIGHYQRKQTLLEQEQGQGQHKTEQKNDSSSNSNNTNTNSRSEENGSGSDEETSLVDNQSESLIANIYRATLELLIDKATLIKKINDRAIRLYQSNHNSKSSKNKSKSNKTKKKKGFRK